MTWMTPMNAAFSVRYRHATANSVITIQSALPTGLRLMSIPSAPTTARTANRKKRNGASMAGRVSAGRRGRRGAAGRAGRRGTAQPAEALLAAPAKLPQASGGNKRGRTAAPGRKGGEAKPRPGYPRKSPTPSGTGLDQRAEPDGIATA